MTVPCGNIFRYYTYHNAFKIIKTISQNQVRTVLMLWYPYGSFTKALEPYAPMEGKLLPIQYNTGSPTLVTATLKPTS